MQLDPKTRRTFGKAGEVLRRHPFVGFACTIVLIAAVLAGTAGAVSLRQGIVVERAGGEGSTLLESGSIPSGNPAGSADASGTGEEERIVIDVGGAVRHPGVVELAAGARVADAVEAAGGLAKDADTSGLNQAALLSDGQKVLVPREGEELSTADSGVSPSDTGGAGAVAPDPSGTASALVNINSATAEELDTLPGVGPATAQAIIEDREGNGPFSSPEDLMRVSGIGEKKFAKLEGLICV